LSGAAPCARPHAQRGSPGNFRRRRDNMISIKRFPDQYSDEPVAGQAMARIGQVCRLRSMFSEAKKPARRWAHRLGETRTPRVTSLGGSLIGSAAIRVREGRSPSVVTPLRRPGAGRRSWPSSLSVRQAYIPACAQPCRTLKRLRCISSWFQCSDRATAAAPRFLSFVLSSEGSYGAAGDRSAT
jgi:hypothetical protein